SISSIQSPQQTAKGKPRWLIREHKAPAEPTNPLNPRQGVMRTVRTKIMKIKMHLRTRHLEEYLEEPMSKEPHDDKLQGALRTCSILSKAILNAIFTSVINNNNEQDPHAIWTDIKTIYASDSLLSVFQVWNKWLDIQYNQDMNT
ncbi:hypothetical protein PTTG_30008, partial [Puccinia triticina 1-1 BBBD Race 1]